MGKRNKCRNCEDGWVYIPIPGKGGARLSQPCGECELGKERAEEFAEDYDEE